MLKPSLSKIDKSLKMPAAFLIFFDLVYALLICVLYPGKYIKSNFIVWPKNYGIYFTGGFGLITIIFWIICQFTDPGFIQKPKKVDFLVSSYNLTI